MYQHKCDVIAPNASSQDVGHWSRIIMRMALVVLGLFEIMIRMALAVIIDTGLSVTLFMLLCSVEVNKHPCFPLFTMYTGSE